MDSAATPPAKRTAPRVVAKAKNLILPPEPDELDEELVTAEAAPARAKRAPRAPRTPRARRPPPIDPGMVPPSEEPAEPAEAPSTATNGDGTVELAEVVEAPATEPTPAEPQVVESEDLEREVVEPEVQAVVAAPSPAADRDDVEPEGQGFVVAPAPTVEPVDAMPIGQAPPAPVRARIAPPPTVPPVEVPAVAPTPVVIVPAPVPVAIPELFDDESVVTPAVPMRQLRQPVTLTRRRRPRVRRVTRVVRHVDTWSVFKIALLFNLFFYIVCVTASVLLWQVAQSTGTVDNVERFFEGFGWETFSLKGGELYHNLWIAGLFLVIGFTGLAVLVATMFNLITDLVGGVRVTVLEEEVVSRVKLTTLTPVDPPEPPSRR